MKINNEKVINEYFDELNSLREYVPYALLKFMTDYYFNNIDGKTRQKINDTIRLVEHLIEEEIEDPSKKGITDEFINHDLTLWMNNHKEYENIIFAEEDING